MVWRSTFQYRMFLEHTTSIKWGVNLTSYTSKEYYISWLSEVEGSAWVLIPPCLAGNLAFKPRKNSRWGSSGVRKWQGGPGGLIWKGYRPVPHIVGLCEVRYLKIDCRNSFAVELSVICNWKGVWATKVATAWKVARMEREECSAVRTRWPFSLTF